MKAVRNLWLGAVMLALYPAGAVAQQAGQSSSGQAAQQPAAKQDQKTKPAPTKTAKVWTEDDISSVRTPADDYMDVERTQTQAAAGAAADAAAKQKQTAATNPPQKGAPTALSNPKTTEDADKMIAWEQRDIDSQQEYLQKLQDQLATAPDDQKAHIQAWIDQEIKTIADTKKEQAGLESQKKDLEKKAAPASGGSAQQPQSQQ
ncbi:MAG TPA: hypothetical protein VGR72_10440 [Candidatus Acidoferrales bacterium]|nr:hypothetical protein [Candidatus Acidoferrales bacterium]